MQIQKKSDLRQLTVKELRAINSDNGLEIVGAWNMRKDDLVEEIFNHICEAWNLEDDETIIEVEEPKKKKGSRKAVRVFLEGELFGEFDSILAASKELEKELGGKLYEGLKAIVKGNWKPKRGQMVNVEAELIERAE